VPPERYVHYERRAMEFRVAALTAASAEHWNVAVANAVHSAISAADAVAVRYLGRRSGEPSHLAAVPLLRSLPAQTPGRDRAIRHLLELLNVKSDAEYGEERLTAHDWHRVADHLDRLLNWVRAQLSLQV
jgi:hypothetical protein